MSKIYLYSTFIAIMSFISCSKEKSFNDKKSEKSYPVLFKSSKEVVSNHKINCCLQLRTNLPGDTLLLSILLENNSRKTISIKPGNLQIESSRNIRSDVIWFDSTKLDIFPHSFEILKVKFSPINNLMLYDRINYKGDMDSVYYVTINFIEEKNEQRLFGDRIKFYLQKNSYEDYQKKFAIDRKIQIFQLMNNNELKANLKSAVLTINGGINNKRPTSIEVSPTDIMLNGGLVKLNFYQLDSNLYLRTRIINHGDYALRLMPEKFLVNIKGKILKPNNLSILNSSKDSLHFIINKGGRLELLLRYNCFTSNRFSLSAGLFFMDNSMPLVPFPLSFIADTTIY